MIQSFINLFGRPGFFAVVIIIAPYLGLTQAKAVPNPGLYYHYRPNRGGTLICRVGLSSLPKPGSRAGSTPPFHAALANRRPSNYHSIRMNGSLPVSAPANSAELPTVRRWVETLRTLADPMRCRIIRLLEHAAGPGLRVGELAQALKLPQSTVSRHIKNLVEAGAVDGRRDGTSMFYRLAPLASSSAIRQLRSLARDYLAHDEQVQADEERLLRVLQQRQRHNPDFFHSSAPQWDIIRTQWFGESFHLEAMLAALDPNWIVGDLGAGTGTMAALLAPHVRRAAKSRIKTLEMQNVTLVSGRLESLPPEVQSLDMALVSLVLHHVEDIRSALGDIFRVLKPGGFLLIVDLMPHDVEMFKEKMGHRWMGFAPGQMMEMLSQAGFINIRRHTLAARKTRSRQDRTAVPDLFVMRASRPLDVSGL
ncbi:MAG: ArsR/SmtB family transcription factor [Acidimicrobiales bacterium]